VKSEDTKMLLGQQHIKLLPYYRRTRKRRRRRGE